MAGRKVYFINATVNFSLLLLFLSILIQLKQLSQPFLLNLMHILLHQLFFYRFGCTFILLSLMGALADVVWPHVFLLLRTTYITRRPCK